MTTEDKELLLCDLCARLPYGVKIETFTNCWTSKKGVYELKEIFQGDDGLFRVNDLGFTIEHCKPYLFPMSSIIEEQEKYLMSLMEKTSIPFWGEVLTPSIEYFDYLNKNHFDYRRLIEKELAINAIGLNIY